MFSFKTFQTFSCSSDSTPKRECSFCTQFGLKELLQNRKGESCTVMAVDTHSSYLEIRERKRGEICWQRVQDTLVTNLSSELQHLAEKHGMTASYTTTHKMIQSLIVGGFSDHPAISPAWQRLCHTQVLRELSVRCTMDTKHIRDKVCFKVTEKLPVCGYEYGGGRVCTQIFARSWKNVMCVISGHWEN